MKIWIDARICDEKWYYANYVCELVEAFVAKNQQHNITVYRKNNLPHNRRKFLDERKSKKIFEAEKFALMIFFDSHIPSGYSWEYIVILQDLKELFFPKKKWIQRKFYSMRLRRAISKSIHVLMLDSESAMELNESLDVSEDKIGTIPWFFPFYKTWGEIPVTLNIKSKLNLRGEYIIYDSGNELHNNFERVLKALKNLKDRGIILYLLVLCEETTKDLDIRSKVIEYKIWDQIHFLGTIPKEEEYYYYTQSLWVVFSSIYESFPFHFTKAIAYNCRIFANNIPAISSVMGDRIYYLDPLSVHNMSDTLEHTLWKSAATNYYTLPYSPVLSALKLSEYIEAKN